MRSAWIVAVVAVTSTARADEIYRVDVEVGKTAERDVGYARGGWFCDDATLVTGELVTRNDSNFWIVTGVKAGSTQCRVGADRHRPVWVFDLVVTQPAKKAPKPPKQGA